MSEQETYPDDSMAQVIEETKLRILHALEVFPFISGSMVHLAIGTATSGTLWKPILQGLLKEGRIKIHQLQAKGPTGRMQTYTLYHLPKNKYVFGENVELIG